MTPLPPLLQRDCAERFEGRLAFDGRLHGNPRLYGRFLGDLYAKDLITMGTARGRVAPFGVPKNDGRQRLFLDTREANHHFAPPPHTTCRQSEFVIASVATRCCTFLRHRVMLSVVVFLPASVSALDGTVPWGFRHCEKASTALVTESLGHFCG